MTSNERNMMVDFAGQLGEMKGLMVSANEKLDDAKVARAGMCEQLDDHEARLITQEHFNKTVKFAVRSAWVAALASVGTFLAWLKTVT